jgi:hypothetical protein
VVGQPEQRGVIDREKWLQALGDMTVDNNAITIAEFGAMIGRKNTQAKVRMAALIKAGKAKPVRRQITDVTGRPHIVPAYVLVNK